MLHEYINRIYGRLLKKKKKEQYKDMQDKSPLCSHVRFEKIKNKTTPAQRKSTKT